MILKTHPLYISMSIWCIQENKILLNGGLNSQGLKKSRERERERANFLDHQAYILIRVCYNPSC
jgi:hypothetical protein